MRTGDNAETSLLATLPVERLSRGRLKRGKIKAVQYFRVRTLCDGQQDKQATGKICIR